MKNNSLTVYCDVPKAVTSQKMLHVTRKGQHAFRVSAGFCLVEGDVPVALLSESGSHQAVDNQRGNAYAHRKALRYRKTKKQKLANEEKGLLAL
tara:strand:- start:268336 stop:268617 length:282 start_codon:yes stop_codon:yes gene_type:complete